MNKNFLIRYNELPPSVNKYLRPSIKYNDIGEPIPYLYETEEAKKFKRRFARYLKVEVSKQNWDIETTKEGHWYLDCFFFQARTSEDNNNYYKILCDALKGTVIADDNNVLIRTQKVVYDSKNPRFVAILKRVDYIGIFESKAKLNEFTESNCQGCSRFNRNCSILRKAKEGRFQDEIYTEDKVRKCNKRKVKVNSSK